MKRLMPGNVVLATSLISAVLLAATDLAGNAGQGASATSTAVRRVAPFTSLTTPRWAPISRAEATDAQREVLGEGSGEGPIQVRLCLYHPDLCRAYWAMTLQLTTRNITIPIRDHELLVTRTAWLNRSHTIWSNHINAVAERAGLNDDESRAMIIRGPDAPGWTDWERTVLRAADEIHMGRFIKDETWRALAERYNEGQLFEVLMTVGHYVTLIGYFNSVGIQPSPPVHAMPQDPEGTERFPDR